MPPTLSPQAFVAKWRSTTLKERSAAQEHFIDVCHLIGHPTPAEADPTGESFTFEAGTDTCFDGSAGNGPCLGSPYKQLVLGPAPVSLGRCTVF